MAGIVWIEGIVNQPGIVEKICPERHVRQNEWKSDWNDMYGGEHRYDYISDYESIFSHPMNHIDIRKDLMENLQESKREGTSVPITNLAHFTIPHCAVSIVEENGFRGGEKKINEDQGNDITARFSWWSPIFTAQDKSTVRNHLGEVIKPFTGEEESTLKNQFATSDAFQTNSRWYGRQCSHVFKYPMNELLGYYRHHVNDELEYKILGTFGYKKQVMHAVLVCSKTNGAEGFAAYPDVLSPADDVNNEAVITRDARREGVTPMVYHKALRFYDVCTMTSRIATKLCADASRKSFRREF